MQGQIPESETDQFAHLEELARTEPEAPAETGASAETGPDPDMVAWLGDPLGKADKNRFDVEMFQVSTTDEPCSESDAPPTADSGLAIGKPDLTPTVAAPVAMDDELLATIGDTLSPDELQGLAALSLSPPDVDALLEASGKMQAVATQVEHVIDFLPVLDEIHDLRDGLASYQGLEQSLVELSQNSESASNTLMNQLDVLLDEVASLRQETEITRDATLVSTNTVRELVTTMASRKHRIGYRRGGSPGKLGFATLTIALLLCVATIGWAVRDYQLTDELHFAVIGLLVVNLIGGGAVLWSRRN